MNRDKHIMRVGDCRNRRGGGAERRFVKEGTADVGRAAGWGRGAGVGGKRVGDKLS